MSTPESQLAPGDFAKRVREKHPHDYDDVPDDVLVDRVLAKYPDYKSAVKLPDFDAPVTNKWGARRSYGGHTGVDVGYGKGERIGVPLPGRVTFAGERSGYGNRVEVDHGNGILTTYSHLDGFDVKEGDEITPDRPLGRVGNSGGDYRPHLHFEVLRDGQKVNAAETPYRPRRISSSPATPVSGTTLPQSPEAGAASPVISQVNQAPTGARPPLPTGYLDETQETPEDFASLAPRTPKIDPYTEAGRAQRDVRLQAEKEGGALYRVPVSEGVRQAVETIAKDTDVPATFVETWLKQKGLGLYDRETGRALETSPTGFAAIPAEMIGQLKKDYRASLSLPARAVRNVSEVLSTHSPGEVLTGVGEEAAKPVVAAAKAALPAAQFAGDAASYMDTYLWSRAAGLPDMAAQQVADARLKGLRTPLSNPVGHVLKNVPLVRENPRAQAIAEFAGELAQPSNLIPVGLGKYLGRGVRAAAEAGESAGLVGRAASKLRDAGLYTPDIPEEAFKPVGDTRVLGDLTRRVVPETRIEDLPDIPVNEGLAPRVVRRSESPVIEQAAPEAVPVPETLPTAPQASNSPVVETIIKHSDPRIDGGRVVGQTPDGRLKVENNEGGVSIVQHPRRGGNREAALVRREVVNETIGEVPAGAPKPDGQATDDILQTRGSREAQILETETGARNQAQPSRATEDYRDIRGTAEGVTSDPLNAPAPPKGADFNKQLTRTYQSGQNRASLTFDSLEQRDLFDLTSRGSDNVSLQEKQRRAARKEQVRDDLAKRLGVSPEEVMRRAAAVRDDVRAQMRGVGDGESRTLADNVLREERLDATRTPDGAEVQGVEAAGSRAAAASQPPRVSATRPADTVAAPTARLSAPAPRAQMNPEQLRSRFLEGMRTRFRLPEHHAAGVTTIFDELDRGLTKGGLERGELLREVAGVGSGRVKGDALNQAAPKTPEFKRWFGRSKVVDEKGEPLTVYHGTGRDFDAFDPEEIGSNFNADEVGFFFSNKPKSAEGYATHNSIGLRREEGGNIMPVYLSLKNPKIIKIDFDPIDKWDNEVAAQAKRIQAAGHDGIIIKSQKNNDNLYVAFKPEQVKSATGNRGTFDPSDPNILNQNEKAATKFLKDGRAVIQALDNPDVSSGVHEVHHVFAPVFARAVLKAPDATFRETGEAFFKWLGFKDAKEFADLHEGWVAGKLSDKQRSLYVDGQEKGARGFERYLKTGEAPSVQLRQVFADFKDWLTTIYGKITTKGHPLAGKLSPEAIKAWDTVLGEPKGDYGQLINALYKAPDAGTPSFFENPQVKRALRLKPDASADDVRAALAEQIGKPRSSHLSPEDVTKWADSKGLQGAARQALDFATGKYKETIKQPTEYQKTGIRKSNVNPETQSLSEFVRSMGGIRVDRDRANRGELESLTNKEAGTSGLIRKDGMSVYDMAHAAAEAGYPVGSEGGYVRRELMDQNAGVEEASADTLVELLARDLGGDRVYSSQREVDYEAQYRKENPDDSTEALEAFVMTERGGILFDKVDEGSATRAETAEFRRLAGEAGVHPEHVRRIVARGEAAKAEGVSNPAGSKPEDDFDFRDDPLDEDRPDFLYQSAHKPEQLGFANEGLTQESARQGQVKPKLDDARTDAAKKALGAEAYTKLSALKDSPVARLASEVEKRVTPTNAQNAPDVVAALSKLAELKRQKQTVDDYLNQGSLFGERELSPAQERILSGLDRNPRKVIDEAFPAQKAPEQDVLFQADHTAASRRQRVYRALLEAKGQGSFVPDLAPEPLPGRDSNLTDFFRTPLSNLDFKGTYERLGGEPGKKVSNAFREAQFQTDERLNELRKTTKPDELEEAERIVRREELDKLRAALRPLIARLRDGGKPELAEDVTTHLNALSGAPTKFERAVGNLIRETPGLGRVVRNPELAMRHTAARLTSLQATLKLKYNIRSSLVNLTDPLTTLWPYASTKDMAAVYADFLKPSTRKMLADKGVTGGVTKLDEAGLVKTRQGLADKLSPFRKASEINRSVAYLYGLKEAKRAGKTGEDAHRLALDWAKKVEFDNSVWNAPPMLRSSAGKVLGQFKGYQVKSFENLANVVRKKETDRTFTRAARVSKFVAGKGVVGGLRAGGLLTKTAGFYAAGALAYQLMQKGYSKEEAEKVADTVYYGAPALIGLDLSGSVMMFEPPFGYTLTEQAVNTVGGPTIGTGLKVGQGVKDAYAAEDGKKKSREEKLATIGNRTVNALTPYYKMGKSGVETYQGKPTQKLGSEEVPVTQYEGVMKALGFTLTKQTKFYDERDFQKPKTGRGGTLGPKPPPVPRPPRISQ